MKKNYVGIIYAVMASIFQSIMAYLVKRTHSSLSCSTIICTRFLISWIFIILIVIYEKTYNNQNYLYSKSLILQIARGLMLLLTMVLFFNSLLHIALSNATILLLTSPLYIPIFMMVFNKKKIDLRQTILIAFGFIGIILVINPNMDIMNTYSIQAFGSGITGAFAIYFLSLNGKKDHPYTSMFYSFSITFILSLLYISYNGNMFLLFSSPLLLYIGLAGTAYQWCLIKSASYCSAISISTTMYLSVIFSSLFDYVTWHTKISLVTLSGILIIFIACIAVLLLDNTFLIKNFSIKTLK